MSLFGRTIKYRLKSQLTTPRGIVFLALGLVLALSPFIGLIIPDAPIPIGWIDEDNTAFSAMLKQNVDALDVVSVFEEDEQTLIANLQTGKIEGVFVIKQGFEQSIKNGEYEDTLQMLRSPYTTAAGVISESVGGEAMRLWLTCYSANTAKELGGENLYNSVFEHVGEGTSAPIISLVRQNEAGQTGEVTPIKDAAFSSLYLLAAFVCFYMLVGLSLPKKSSDFAGRLKSRAFCMAKYSLAVSIADTAFILPCIIIPLAAFGIAGADALILPLLIMFVLYVLAFGGIASLVSKIENQTALMLCISVVTIANVMFGSLLISLPFGWALSFFTYALPSRWLSSLEGLGVFWSILGLVGCAIVYNVLPFLPRKKDV